MPTTVRLFVSSTFRDMHAERDHLNRHVFPRLSDRCSRRGLEFVALDLRWGVTEEEAQQRGAAEVCLEEVDRCRPFFLGLLGERYGWVPAPEEAPADLFDRARAEEPGKAHWLGRYYALDLTSVPPAYRLRRDAALPDAERIALARFWEGRGLPGAGLSITELEVRRALEGATARALFYLREPGPNGLVDHPGFPPALRDVFREADEGPRLKLGALRRELAARGAHTYRADFAGVVSDPTVEAHAAVALTGMEEFGERVLEELWAAIEAEAGRVEAARPRDAHERERAGHERFLRSRTGLFLGRDDLLGRLHAYAEGGEDRPLVITGPPGVGKSALLARFVDEQRGRRSGLVLPHFIGAVPGSDQLPATLRTLLEALNRAAGGGPALPADPRGLRYLLPGLLRRVAERGPALVVIDALDQLDPAGRGQDLDWLPDRLPGGVKLVVSTLPGPCLAQALALPGALQPIEVLPLSQPGRRAVVREFLAGRRKALAAGQVEALLHPGARPDAGLPLYLRVALEELCLFGSHEALDARIARLPASVPELFDQVLGRLEADHGRGTVETAVGLLAASRSGLTEGELLALLRAREPGFSPSRWARLYHALRPFLRPADEEAGEGLIGFFHVGLRRAAFARYLGMEHPEAPASDACRAAHRVLADHFRAAAQEGGRGWRADRPRTLAELPHHLQAAGAADDLAGLFLEGPYLAARATAGQVFGLTQGLSAAARALPADHPAAHLLALLGRAMRREANFLAEHPEHLFACLWNAGWWADAPQAEPFFEAPPGGWDESSAWRAPGARLSAFLQDWRERHPPAGLWVRSLAPPPMPLHVPLDAAFRGHQDKVSAVALSADGRWLASSSGFGDYTTRVWEVTTGAELTALSGARQVEVAAVTVSPDGRRVATGNFDGGVRVYDARSGAELQALRVQAGVLSVAFSPDGRRVAAGYWDRNARVWDIETGAEALVLGPHGGQVTEVRYSPDGRRLATSSDDAVCLWDADTGAPLLSLPHAKGYLPGLAFSRDGRLLASGGADGVARVWDAASGAELRGLPGHKGGLQWLAFDVEGGRLATVAQDGQARVWDWAAGEVRLDLAEAGKVSVVGYTPDGRLVTDGADGAVRLWEAGTPHVRLARRGQGGTITGLSFSPDGRFLVTRHEGGILRLWEFPGGLARPAYELPGVSHWAFAPDSARLATSGPAGAIVRGLAGADTLATFDLGGAGGALAFSPDGRELAVALGQAVRLLDADTGAQRLVLEGHPRQVKYLAFAPDGLTLASTSLDNNRVSGVARIWGSGGGELLHELKVAEGAPGACFGPDGRLALRSYQQVFLFDATDGRELLQSKTEDRWRARVQRYSTEQSRQVSAVLPRPGGETEVLGLLRFGSFGARPDWSVVVSLVSPAGTRNVRQALVWDADTGATLFATQDGARSQNALFEGPLLAVFGAARHSIGTAVVAAGRRAPVAWFEAPLELIARHPGGRMWAGATGEHLFAFALEG